MDPSVPTAQGGGRIIRKLVGFVQGHLQGLEKLQEMGIVFDSSCSQHGSCGDEAKRFALDAGLPTFYQNTMVVHLHRSVFCSRES